MGRILEILNGVKEGGRRRLTEYEAKEVLKEAGVGVARGGVARTEDEAVGLAGRMGYPVVLKIVSADILHKTEAGGVKIGVRDEEGVRLAYREIIGAVRERHGDAEIEGILVEEMIAGGIETIVGVANREPFGPVVAFGLGGVLVEVLKDVTLRLAPVDEAGALEMIGEIKGARVLDGYRGQDKADRGALARAIVRVSKLAVEFHREMEEMDINPLVVRGDRVVALDALITLKSPEKEREWKKGRRGFTYGMDAVLEPRSVAVIGASANPEKTGHVLFKNIVVNGFPGKVYPINPREKEILGIKAYPTILDVPGEIDLVFFLLPGEFVPVLYEDCKKKGVKAAVIIAAGFGEVGAEGREAQERLVELIEKTGIRCLGPNSIGFINMDQRLVASFILFRNWEDGTIALGGQSGIFAGAVADQVMGREVQRLGIGKSVIFGNKIDLDESDYLEWAWRDGKSKIMALHLEGMSDPRRFFSIANGAKRDMPIVVLKPGRTPSGAGASASHTGSLALDDAVVDCALRQYGITRAYDLEEFLEFMKGFQYQPLPRGNRVGIVTFSGANGVMASDELDERGFELARFGPGTQERIKRFFPVWQPVANPLDLWAALGAGNRLVHEEGIHAVLDDEGVDAVLVILLALANADFEGIREVYQRARERHPEKPLYTVALGGEVKQRWLREVEGLHMPFFETTTIAIKTLDAARRYALVREKMQPDPILP